MCYFCGHEKKGGEENTAIGLWSKGISLIFCSSIFLLHIIENDGFLLLKHNPLNQETKMLYYLSIGNLIGATVLLLFSLLGHFINKTLLRPIYLSSFIVSLLLFSSGVYTTSLCKNASLNIVSIMDALKYHPDYMILKSVEHGTMVDRVKNFKEGVSSKVNVTLPVDEGKPENKEKEIVLSETLQKKDNGIATNGPIVANNPSVANNPNGASNPNVLDASASLAFLGDPALVEKIKANALLDTINMNTVLQKIKEISELKGEETVETTQNLVLLLYDKIKSMKSNFAIYDKIAKYAASTPILIPAVQKMEDVTAQMKYLLNIYGGSFFQVNKFDIIKHENRMYKIYEKSLARIKEVQLQNPTPSLQDYISDELRKRNIFLIASTLIFMSFIYIHKGATLTSESSVSISILYLPCMSYTITLACVFVCSGIFSLSILGSVMYVLGMILMCFLIFAQCFCERFFKCLMGVVFLFLFVYSMLMQFIMIKEFNRGNELYLEYKKNNYEDLYWILLDTDTYETFKRCILFSNGNLFLVGISLCMFIIIFSLFCVFYNFRSIFTVKKKVVSFA